MPYELWKPEMGIIRKGKCRRCGRCCASRIGECPYFRFVAVKDIPKGAEISQTGEGTSLVSKCLIFDEPTTWRHCTPEVRKSFPSMPTQLLGNCGFWFVDDKGRRLVVKERQIWVET